MPKLLLTVVALLLASVGWVGLKQYQSNRQVLGARIVKEIEIEKNKELLAYWQQIASDSPTYQEAWIQLSVLSYQLSSSQEAKLYLEKALELDPNWVVPPQLEPLLL